MDAPKRSPAVESIGPVESACVDGGLESGNADSLETGPVDSLETGPVDVDSLETGPVDSLETAPVGSCFKGPVDSVCNGPVEPIEALILSIAIGPVDSVWRDCCS